MRSLEVALVEWPDGRDAGGPRVLGQVTDPELVAHVQSLIAAARRRELASLEPPVRLAPREEPDDGPRHLMPGKPSVDL